MVTQSVCADLQNHLGHLAKRIDRPQRIIERAVHTLGNGILGITNYGHALFYEALLDSMRAADVKFEDLGNAVRTQAGVLIVKTQEVATRLPNGRLGEYIAVGLPRDRRLKDGRPFRESLREAREEGLLTILIHPFFVRGAGPAVRDRPEILLDFDGYEIYTGTAVLPVPGFWFANRRARFFFQQVRSTYAHLAPVASSDGHSTREIGTSYTRLVVDKAYALLEGPADVIGLLRTSFAELARHASPDRGIDETRYRFGSYLPGTLRHAMHAASMPLGTSDKYLRMIQPG